MNRVTELYIFALGAQGKGISGSDRIFIELARRWSKVFSITIYVTKEGYDMCRRQKLVSQKVKFKSQSDRSKLKICVVDLKRWAQFGFLVDYLARIVEGIRLGFTLKLTDNQSKVYIYNASEFWMDSLPCVLLKMRYHTVQWIATWFQTAPSPVLGYREKGKVKSQKRINNYNSSALFYWLMQLPIKPLTSRFADKIIVNNKDEKKQFPKHTARGNTIVLIGAVPLVEIKSWKLKIGNLPKIYDAVFQGRFHPQKGVVELINIWKRVVKEIPTAKLAMIGDGPLMQEVKSQISKLKLKNNISLFGYVFDGLEKFKILSQSKIVVHPAFYDSGGMASAEAMAFGLPCVGFDLVAYRSYYPKGMLKAKDVYDFSDLIIQLLRNKRFRIHHGTEARSLIEKKYSWEYRSNEILKAILT